MDDDHPVGAGRPGYRVIYKTVGLVPVPFAGTTGPNMRVVVQTSQPTLGEPRFPGAFASRRLGTFMVPDSIALVPGADPTNEIGEDAFRISPTTEVRVTAHQEDLPLSNYLEVTAVFDSDTAFDYEALLAAGRAFVAPFVLALDLYFGPRLVGPRAVEEVGEVFDDWHFNRFLGGRYLEVESEVGIAVLPGNAFQDAVGDIFKRQRARTPEDRGRLRVAAQWYWRAVAEPEPAQEFVCHWLSLEALECSSSDIRPIQDAVAGVLSDFGARVRGDVGRLYGARCRILHGKALDIETSLLDRMRATAVALLDLRTFGAVAPARLEALRAAYGLGAYTAETAVSNPSVASPPS